MKTIRRLIHREALLAVTFVTAGFLALFFFFDLVDELRWVGKAGAQGYQLPALMRMIATSSALAAVGPAAPLAKPLVASR